MLQYICIIIIIISKGVLGSIEYYIIVHMYDYYYYYYYYYYYHYYQKGSSVPTVFACVSSRLLLVLIYIYIYIPS